MTMSGECVLDRPQKRRVGLCRSLADHELILPSMAGTVSLPIGLKLSKPPYAKYLGRLESAEHCRSATRSRKSRAESTDCGAVRFEGFGGLIDASDKLGSVKFCL